MGPGIAVTYAAAGYEVTMYGRTQAGVDRGLRSAKAAVSTLIESGCVTKEEGSGRLERIKGSTNLERATAGATLVTESIVEDIATKQDLFGRLEGMCPAHAVLTSNTSGLPATQIAAVLSRPGRFAVTHFWNPPHLMPLVEVVKAKRTTQETVDGLVSLLRSAGKKPVIVWKDTPGQLGNRLFHALIREAIWIVQEGIASAEDVDTAIKNGPGRRFPVYGTLEHQDVVGLDMVLAIQTYMCRALCNDTEPARMLRNHVAEGNLGVKSGKGFYDWSKMNSEAVISRRDSFLAKLLKEELSGDGQVAGKGGDRSAEGD